MTDRRRVARFAALLVAALAVAGTSAPLPTPGPTQRLDLSGAVHLTTAQPAAIVPLDFSVETGDVAWIDFTPTLTGLPDDGSVLASIEGVDEAGTRGIDPLSAEASVSPATRWLPSCRAPSCQARYALVITWLGAPAGGAADVSWALQTVATYRGPSGGPAATPGRVSLTAGEPVEAAANLSTTTSGKPSRLSEVDRFRTWTVTLTRPTPEPGADEPPPIAHARLAVAATQVSGDPFAVAEGDRKDARLYGRSDPPVQLRVSRMQSRPVIRWAAEGPLEFDPFAGVGCDPTERCVSTLTVTLAWADGRPETAFDASWTLDLAAISAGEGSATPIESAVEPLAPLHVATTSASGTFDIESLVSPAPVEFTVRAPKLGDALQLYQDIGVPARALVRARVTSIGSTPLPADAQISVSVSANFAGPGSSSILLEPDEEGTFAFEPNVACSTGISGVCQFQGSMLAGIQQPNRNSANVSGMAARIDWSMEVGIGTADSATITIEVEPVPSRKP